jgi:DNA-binding response OmpR family regulator
VRSEEEVVDVLIVDDNHEVSHAFGRVLERAGYMVKIVDNGLAAFAELQQGPFSVIVLDILMPFLEGKSFFRQLEADFPEMTKRVLFVTGAGDDETRDFIERTGQPLLEKPVDTEEFVEAVRSLAHE